MLELGRDAWFTSEGGGGVAVIASANDGGRPEDESHGVLARVAMWVTIRRLCQRVTSLDIGHDHYVRWHRREGYVEWFVGDGVGCAK
jgi:hypothetical protein